MSAPQFTPLEIALQEYVYWRGAVAPACTCGADRTGPWRRASRTPPRYSTAEAHTRTCPAETFDLITIGAVGAAGNIAGRLTGDGQPFTKLDYPAIAPEEKLLFCLEIACARRMATCIENAAALLNPERWILQTPALPADPHSSIRDAQRQVFAEAQAILAVLEGKAPVQP